ncbi:unnamed protein product [Staurois parvus]|uniref:Uncharacterized protein n=1 Tax=Staurois parvus TaxID=386267 RepID=A0ABN9EM86_9NEOB|nr:unnamed protein product [Staurois parvus]
MTHSGPGGQHEEAVQGPMTDYGPGSSKRRRPYRGAYVKKVPPAAVWGRTTIKSPMAEWQSRSSFN